MAIALPPTTQSELPAAIAAELTDITEINWSSTPIGNLTIREDGAPTFQGYVGVSRLERDYGAQASGSKVSLSLEIELQISSNSISELGILARSWLEELSLILRGLENTKITRTVGTVIYQGYNPALTQDVPLTLGFQANQDNGGYAFIQTRYLSRITTI